MQHVNARDLRLIFYGCSAVTATYTDQRWLLNMGASFRLLRLVARYDYARVYFSLQNTSLTHSLFVSYPSHSFSIAAPTNSSNK